MTITPPSSPSAGIMKKRVLEPQTPAVLTRRLSPELSIEDILRKLPADVASSSYFSRSLNTSYNFFI
jgi:hypothetical protein